MEKQVVLHAVIEHSGSLRYDWLTSVFSGPASDPAPGRQWQAMQTVAVKPHNLASHCRILTAKKILSFFPSLYDILFFYHCKLFICPGEGEFPVKFLPAPYSDHPSASMQSGCICLDTSPAMWLPSVHSHYLKEMSKHWNFYQGSVQFLGTSKHSGKHVMSPWGRSSPWAGLVAVLWEALSPHCGGQGRRYALAGLCMDTGVGLWHEVTTAWQSQSQVLGAGEQETRALVQALCTASWDVGPLGVPSLWNGCPGSEG